MMKIFFTILHISWSLTADFIPPTRSPPPARSQAFMAYLSSRSSIIIFGGWNGVSSYDDLWEFSLSSSIWTKITPSSIDCPQARLSTGGYASLTDPKFYIFGGLTLLGPQNDFWEFSFNSMKWVNIQTNSPPSPRSYYGFTTFTKSDIQFFVIQSGISFDGEVNDLFILNCSSFQWEELPANGEIPLPSSDPIVEYYNDQILQAAGSPTGAVSCLPYLYSYSLIDLKWSVISNKKSVFTCRQLTESFIFQDKLFIVFGWLYEISQDSNDIVSIDLQADKKDWKTLKIWPELAGDGFSLVTVESSGYIFGGFSLNLNSYTNKLGKISLEQMKHLPINENFILPKPRSLHSMVIINFKLYLFGGMDSGQVFNDLWTFDLMSNVWEQVSAKGEVPSPRFAHGSHSEGDAFVIWGGESLNGLKDDLFIFNSITGIWTQLVSSSFTKPSPAKGACLVFRNFKVFIYGGKRDSDLSNELWVYDIGTNLFELLSDSLSYGSIRVSFPFCWLDSNLFYVSLGVNEIEGPSTSIDFFNLSSSTWSNFHHHDLTSSDSAQSNQFFTGSSLITIGGQLWMQTLIKKISVLGPGNKRVVLKTDLNFNTYGSAFVYFNKSLYIFGGGVVLGQSLILEVGSTIFAKIELKEICDEAGCEATCSPGTFSVNGRCEACKIGTFSVNFGRSQCEECRAGTYNKKIASASQYQCLPCPEGYFSNMSAVETCKECPEGKYCPIGSTSPSDYIQSQSGGSYQPSLYQEPDLSETLIIYRVMVSVPIFIGLISCVFVKKLRNKMTVFDLFDSQHDDDESDYMIKKKTKIGAFFSILYVIGVLLLTCTTVLSYLKANIQETKGLVPLVVLESEVSSFQAKEIFLQVSLLSYGGQCEKNLECLPSIKISLDNINCDNIFTSCKLSKTDTCIVRVTCEKGEIKTGAQVSFTLKESLSFSSGIEVNLTTSSSIPDQISSVSSVLMSRNGTIFIGSVASEFFFLATPSLFKSESSKWTDQQTGFHISEKNTPSFGSQFSPEELPAVSYLNIKVLVEISSTALLTQRLLKQDFVFFIGAFLGTASGLFGIAGFVMSFVEKRVEKIVKRMKKSQVVENSNEFEINERGCNKRETTKLDFSDKK